MKWVAKAIIQKTISGMPFSHLINYLFQRYVTRGVVLSDQYLKDRLEHTRRHLAGFTLAVGGIPVSCLELGTGWYPVVPVSLYISGVNAIHTVDLTRHLTKGRILETLVALVRWKDAGKLSAYLNIEPQRWESLLDILAHSGNLSFDQLMEALELHYHVTDARQLPLETGSVNLAISNNTLEHIPRPVMEQILKEFERVTRGGLSSHFVDMTDHFAHMDKSISIYHYLRYAEWQWAMIDNAIQPQNRLRADDYRTIFAPLTLIHEELWPGDQEAFHTARLAPAYQHRPAELVSASHGHWVFRNR